MRTTRFLDSEVPVRQMMEQIITRLGLPPGFILGLSWSSTERMSSQQADVLTKEMEAYRMLLNPSIEKICSLWLTLHGYDTSFEIVWDTITMQDRVEEADARLKHAQAEKLEWGNSKGKGGKTVNGAIIKHMQTDVTRDLECINQYTRRPFTEQEVYTFSVVLCDNEIDRDFERFSVEALHTLSQLF